MGVSPSAVFSERLLLFKDNSYRCYLLIWIARQLLVIWFWSLHLLFKSLLSGESGLLQSNLAEFSEPYRIWPQATKIINFEY